MAYRIHDENTAAPAARGLLAGAKQALGFVPNILGVMAEAPALVNAYGALSKVFEETSFSPTERAIVLLSASAENGCTYCVAVHTVLAGMEKVPADVVASIRSGTPIGDSRLEALRRFTTAMVAKRGWPSDDDTKTFLGAGYTRAQVLEVILGIGLKTLSNYTTHVAEPPLDAAFFSAAWEKVK